MAILLLDTSMQGALLGLAKPEVDGWRLQQALHYASPQEAAAALPRMLDTMFDEEGLALRDLQAIAIGAGPGSFTGIKIGLSFVYGIKRAFPQLPMIGLSALRALAAYENGGKTKIWVLPATQTSGYFAMKQGEHVELGVVQASETVEGKWTLEIRARDVAFDPQPRLLDWPSSLHIIGTWPRLSQRCPELGVESVESSVTELSRSILEGMLHEFVVNSAQLSDGLPRPLYLRRSAPEEKLAQTKAHASLSVSEVSVNLHKPVSDGD